MEILVMGGTRFVGKPLVERLLAQGHSLTLFTRGRNPLPAGVEHLAGDRSTPEGLQPLAGRRFDVIVDSSGRTVEDSRAVVERTGAPSHRFVYVSSAGVYADSELWPLREDSPTYIVGPGNYNPVESWFFDRIVHGRPVPLPGDGSTITQLGHVEDLAAVMDRCIGVDAAANRIYNCSSSQGITFAGLVAAAARACGKDPAAVEIRSFDPAGLDKKARKAFPLRLAHFLTDITRVQSELAWTPAYDVELALADSYANDYAQRMPTSPDFSGDSALIG